MKRIAWITDIHLDFVSGQGLSAFLCKLYATCVSEKSL